MDDIEQIKAKFLNHEFDEKSFDVDAHQAAEFAITCGETSTRFTDPGDPDFQAIPTYASSLTGGRALPEGFPMFGGIALDGGKTVEPLRPIRPGVPLTGRSHVHDIYTKTGRSGRMIFVISRMELSDPEGEKVAIADTRLVIREKITE